MINIDEMKPKGGGNKCVVVKLQFTTSVGLIFLRQKECQT